MMFAYLHFKQLIAMYDLSYSYTVVVDFKRFYAQIITQPIAELSAVVTATSTAPNNVGGSPSANINITALNQTSSVDGAADSSQVAVTPSVTRIDPSQPTISSNQASGQAGVIDNDNQSSLSIIKLTTKNFVAPINNQISLVDIPSQASVTPSEDLASTRVSPSQVNAIPTEASVTPSEDLASTTVINVLSRVNPSQISQASATPSEDLASTRVSPSQVNAIPTEASVTPSEDLASTTVINVLSRVNPSQISQASVTPSEDLPSTRVSPSQVNAIPTEASVTPSEDVASTTVINVLSRVNPSQVSQASVTPSEDLASTRVSPSQVNVIPTEASVPPSEDVASTTVINVLSRVNPSQISQASVTPSEENVASTRVSASQVNVIPTEASVPPREDLASTTVIKILSRVNPSQVSQVSVPPSEDLPSTRVSPSQVNVIPTEASIPPSEDVASTTVINVLSRVNPSQISQASATPSEDLATTTVNDIFSSVNPSQTIATPSQILQLVSATTNQITAPRQNSVSLNHDNETVNTPPSHIHTDITGLVAQSSELIEATSSVTIPLNSEPTAAQIIPSTSNFNQSENPSVQPSGQQLFLLLPTSSSGQPEPSQLQPQPTPI